VAIRPILSVTAASADSSVKGSNWHVQHGQMISHEEGVEFAGLELLDQLLDVGEIEVGVRPGAGVAPGAGVNRDRSHESAELELPLCHLPRIRAVVSPDWK
jgi:hypothetical protein